MNILLAAILALVAIAISWPTFACVTKAEVKQTIDAIYANPVLWIESRDPHAVSVVVKELAIVRADEVEMYWVRQREKVIILAFAYVEGCAVDGAGSKADRPQTLSPQVLSRVKLKEIHRKMNEAERGIEI